MQTDRCPLCGGRSLTSSWLTVTFEGARFDFLQCSECGSLACSPMPDEKVLERMYDDSYCEDPEITGEPESSLSKFAEVMEFADTLPKGRFLDYGCGDGKLLLEMRTRGWDVLGIDFNPEFASDLRSQGITVIGPNETVDNKGDVVHLGDVIEHLTDIEAQFPAILDLVKDGGYVIAHGPLEANPNLFYLAIKAAKIFRKDRTTEMPPYHVTLATGKGQRALFERFGLEQIRFNVTEVAFPAADALSMSVLKSSRATALFGIRRLSQLISKLDAKNLGNRYFYVGRKVRSRGA